jgi:drug/metabolite transporter (DMT)-like permease
MNPETGAALIGLISGMCWGTGDFFGGVASRRVSHFTVVFFGQAIGTTALVLATLLLGQPIPRAEDLALGAVAGAFGLLGLLMFYRAMAVTKMSVAAPITAVLTVIIPVLGAFALEGVPQAIQLAGMGVALAAIFLISREDNTRIRLADLRLPMIAGLGFGFYLMLLARASGSSPLWPVIAGRFASIALAGIIGWRLGQLRLPQHGAEWRLIAASGLFDTLGNTLYALSAQVGRDDIAAVLSSLYPAATVALAWVFLQERLHRVQWAGVALAFLAIVLISA